MSETTPAVTVRSVTPQDESDWRRLWTGYLVFYESAVPEEVYASTFKRFFTDNEYDPRCLVAEQAGRLVGLVHYLAHRHCWRTENVIYLQDLFADPDVRGAGVGRKLMEAVYAEADRLGCPAVYWTTKVSNDTARRLYDRIGEATDFMKYQRVTG